MVFKSAKRPCCLNCQKPIRHAGQTMVYFGQTEHKVDTWFQYRTERPANKAEAQKLFNQEIISTRRHYQDKSVLASASIWDGESWESEFFCKDACAVRFAYNVARTARDQGRI